jgi:hypothetical protein
VNAARGRAPRPVTERVRAERGPATNPLPARAHGAPSNTRLGGRRFTCNAWFDGASRAAPPTARARSPADDRRGECRCRDWAPRPVAEPVGPKEGGQRRRSAACEWWPVSNSPKAEGVSRATLYRRREPALLTSRARSPPTAPLGECNPREPCASAFRGSLTAPTEDRQRSASGARVIAENRLVRARTTWSSWLGARDTSSAIPMAAKLLDPTPYAAPRGQPRPALARTCPQPHPPAPQLAPAVTCPPLDFAPPRRRHPANPIRRKRRPQRRARPGVLIFGGNALRGDWPPPTRTRRPTHPPTRLLPTALDLRAAAQRRPAIKYSHRSFERAPRRTLGVAAPDAPRRPHVELVRAWRLSTRTP